MTTTKYDILLEQLDLHCKYYREDLCARFALEVEGPMSTGEVLCNCDGKIVSCEIDKVRQQLLDEGLSLD